MNSILSKQNKKYICITIGDIEGIGIHLLLKEFKKGKINDFILITNINIFNKYVKFPKSRINILNENHIYISMARSDAGIASSTAEAMSTGMVCCVSDVAENNLWIKDKNNGFLIEDDNHNELANQIEEIYKKGFYLYNGSVQPLPCTVQAFVFDNLNETNQVRLINRLVESRANFHNTIEFCIKFKGRYTQ